MSVEILLYIYEDKWKDIEKNVIESVQAIEDFAFKCASSNLNSSKTQERKENQRIGKKKVFLAAHLQICLDIQTIMKNNEGSLRNEDDDGYEDFI